VNKDVQDVQYRHGCAARMLAGNKKLSCRRDRAMIPDIEYFASHSRSFKVIWNDARELGVCKFLLVFHCNLRNYGTKLVFRTVSGTGHSVSNGVTLESYRLRSLKMAPFYKQYTNFYWSATARKCSFILYHFRDKGRYWWKIAIVSYALYSTPLLGESLLEYGMEELERCGYRWKKFEDMFSC